MAKPSASRRCPKCGNHYGPESFYKTEFMRWCKWCDKIGKAQGKIRLYERKIENLGKLREEHAHQ